MAFSPEEIEQRRARAPRPEFPPELPICARREEIAKAISSHEVVIVCGETGSGKTTQLPKICLDIGRGIHGLIGHTQPRRIAARATATRVAQELKTEPGGAVGYKIRFTDRVGPRSYIKIMTDGILLAETQGDRELRQYDPAAPELNRADPLQRKEGRLYACLQPPAPGAGDQCERDLVFSV